MTITKNIPVSIEADGRYCGTLINGAKKLKPCRFSLLGVCLFFSSEGNRIVLKVVTHACGPVETSDLRCSQCLAEFGEG
jgi:hypothetical protein